MIPHLSLTSGARHECTAVSQFVEGEAGGVDDVDVRLMNTSAAVTLIPQHQHKEMHDTFLRQVSEVFGTAVPVQHTVLVVALTMVCCSWRAHV